MAEQLILKGTLEGHVSRPSSCRPWRQKALGILTMGYRMAGSPAWPRRWRSKALNDRWENLERCCSRAYSPNMLLSASRDKTLIIWNLTRDESQYGYPKRSLHGHSHIVSDCVCCSPRSIR